MPMDDEGEEGFTLVTHEGLYSPRRVPQGVLDATPHFQSTMDREALAGLAGMICDLRIDDIAVEGRKSEELLKNLLTVL